MSIMAVQQVSDYFPAKSIIGTSFVDALTVVSGSRRVDQLIRLQTRLAVLRSASVPVVCYRRSRRRRERFAAMASDENHLLIGF